MPRSRKPNLAGRIRQKRASLNPPPPADRAPIVTLHVAPLPPPPVIEPAPPPPVIAQAPPPEPTPTPTPEARQATVVVLAPEALPASAPRVREVVPLDPKDEEALRAIEESLAPVASRLDRGPVRPGIVVAVVAVVVGMGIGLAITRGKSQHPPAVAAVPAPTAAVVEAPVPDAPAPPPPPAETSASASASAAPTASASATATAEALASAAPTASASAAPTASASAAPTASASAEPATGDGASATALRDQALELLKKMKDPEAMAAARAALDADPKDAMPYLVLGSALQDLNQWKEAHHIFELCAKSATKGMVDECHAMLRRK
jgi:hypothetical protein